MDGRDQIHALLLIGTVVQVGIKAVSGEMLVVDFGPGFPPAFQGFGAAPIGSGNRVKLWAARCVWHPVTGIVQTVDPFLLRAPCTVRVQWSDGTDNVDVGIRHSVTLVGQMDRIVRDHASIHELSLYELPGNFQILLHGELVLQGKIKAVSELRLGMPLRLLHCVPEFFAVFVFLRSEGREQDPGFNDAAFAGVVAVLAVDFAE